MRKLILLLTPVLFMITNTACTESENPFFQTYNTPHQTAPFKKIKLAHYEPAFAEGMKQQMKEIDEITSNTELPTFENTIVALEQTGELLNRVAGVFYNLTSAETNDEMELLAQKIVPMLTEHSNYINLNEALFARVKAVYEQKDNLSLSEEQAKLLENTYIGFIRRGANLKGEEKERYKALSTQLSTLSLQFGERNLKETNSYQLVINNKEQLSGLPDGIIEAAAETAKEKGVDGWVFTLNAPSYVPFMKYADSRELRKELYMAYNTKCTHPDEYNTEDLIRQIVNARREIANLLGYETYAQYSLEQSMAERSDAVYDLLSELLDAYTPSVC